MLQQTLSGSVRFISLDRNELVAALRAIAERIGAEQSAVKAVRLFGSLARGEQTGTSDVDVLIVLKLGTVGSAMERIRRFHAYFDLPLAVDVLVYAEDQIAQRLQAGDPFLARVWAESRVLWPASSLEW
ncbi:MAG: nucleotidyltransferase domain-containing protein [Thermoflexales bacterium]|nr:nucleotidyltransferase domain-containing protein [Thermoflexales bacterium]